MNCEQQQQQYCTPLLTFQNAPIHCIGLFTILHLFINFVLSPLMEIAWKSWRKIIEIIKHAVYMIISLSSLYFLVLRPDLIATTSTLWNWVKEKTF